MEQVNEQAGIRLAMPMTGGPGEAAEVALFSIGEAAAILRVPPHTLRGWERRHRVPEPLRTASNQRRYTFTDLELLARLKLAAAGPAQSLEAAVVDGALELAVLDQPVWRFIADQLTELILILDQDGRIMDANLAVATAVGVDRRRLSNRPFHALAERSDRNRAAEIAGRPLQRRLGRVVQLRTVESRRAFSFDCWPVHHEQERLLVLVGRASAAYPTALGAGRGRSRIG